MATSVPATNYVNTMLTNGTTYYYVVRTVNASKTSRNSNQASATPVAPPTAPTDLAATAKDQQVSLTWNASTSTASYTVLRGTTSGGPYNTTVTTGVPAAN